ncbi:putative tRNA pseudouridine synthase 1 [Halotydeus destructor]|nr:putative tRNA pseudouridine synthase 1 [Halotydeus destructor]
MALHERFSIWKAPSSDKQEQFPAITNTRICSPAMFKYGPFVKTCRSFYRGLFPVYKDKNVHPDDIKDWITLEAQQDIQLPLHRVGINLSHHHPIEEPFSGVMIFSLGHTEKYLRYLKFLDADHRLVVKFGESTSSHESGSEVTGQSSTDHLTPQLIETACSSFTSPYYQKPIPFMSRKKYVIDHRIRFEDRPESERYIIRRNQLYREETLPESVTISSLQLLTFSPPYARFKVIADPSFNPRSFVSDLCEQLKTCGHVCESVRISLGPITVDDCLRKHELHKDDIKRATDRYTQKIVDVLNPHLDKLKLYRDKRLS